MHKPISHIDISTSTDPCNSSATSLQLDGRFVTINSYDNVLRIYDRFLNMPNGISLSSLLSGVVSGAATPPSPPPTTAPAAVPEPVLPSSAGSAIAPSFLVFHEVCEVHSVIDCFRSVSACCLCCLFS